MRATVTVTHSSISQTVRSYHPPPGHSVSSIEYPDESPGCKGDADADAEQRSGTARMPSPAMTLRRLVLGQGRAPGEPTPFDRACPFPPLQTRQTDIRHTYVYVVRNV